MANDTLTPFVVSGFVALGALIAIALVGLGLWVTKLVREHNETKRARGVAIADFFVDLRAGRPEALERAQREIGH